MVNCVYCGEPTEAECFSVCKVCEQALDEGEIEE
jgi:hypothetical protein